LVWEHALYVYGDEDLVEKYAKDLQDQEYEVKYHELSVRIN